MASIGASKKSSSMKKAFTLVEVLVVVAIIALLAAILFPVFSRARENGRRASCQSNLKQIALGITQYTQDYDEYFPIDFTGFPPNPPPYGWGDRVQPYIKNLQVYQCPSEKTPPSSDPNVGYPPLDATGYLDYYYNAALVLSRGTFDSSGECFNLNGRPAATQGELEQPSLTVLLLDGPSSASFSAMTGGSDPGLASLTIGFQADPRRHLGGSNFAFTDGHVKWYKDDDRLPQSSVVYAMCNTFAQSGDSPTFHFKDFE